MNKYASDVPRYRPEVFEAKTLAAAKHIILTPEQGSTPDSRWEAETAPTTAELARLLDVQANHVVLDFGCGIGRIAKELIETNGCSVVGADISASMMEMAPGYVQSPKFTIVHPKTIPSVVRSTKFDSAYAVWALQHALRPQDDIPLIARSLKPGGKFLVLNTIYRCVPTTSGWRNDGQDVLKLLKASFSQVESRILDEVFPLAGVRSNHFQALCTL